MKQRAAFLTAPLLLAPATAHGSPPEDPDVRPTLPWLAAQLVPSPTVAAGEDGVRGGLRWQVTPLLWSWSLPRGLTPLRILVAEPNVRHAGSTELYLSPEVYPGAPVLVLLRPGLRTYVPVLERGDTLSASFGVSLQEVDGRASAAFEVGAYTLFGIVGLQAAMAPRGGPLAATASLRVRYF